MRAAHLRLLYRHIRSSGLGEHVHPGRLRGYGVLELDTRCEPDVLRRLLLATGQWVADPLPWLQPRLKPWVVWSLRERRVGPGLHLEREADAMVVHIDVAGLGRCLPLALPAHVVVDGLGWRAIRPLLLATLGGIRC